MVDHRSPALVGGTEADQRLDPVAPSLRRFVASFDPVLGFLVRETGEDILAISNTLSRERSAE
jgi:hypothetical protein